MKSKSASAAGSITMRVRINNQPSAFGTLTAKIEELGGQIGAIDISKVDKDYQVRDITIYTSGPEHAEEITNAVDQLKGISVIHVSDRTFLLHLGGKIEIKSKIPLKIGRASCRERV